MQDNDATHALDEQAQAAASLPETIGPYRILGRWARAAWAACTWPANRTRRARWR